MGIFSSQSTFSVDVLSTSQTQSGASAK